MNKIKCKKNKKYITKNNSGNPNGFVVPIINKHDKFVEDEQWPQQVYMTVASPNEIKGPHLHLKRWGLFTCIKGNVKIVVKINEQFYEYFWEKNMNIKQFKYQPEFLAALINIGNEDAYILNMPSPAWHADDLDEWEVSFDSYKF